MLGLSEAAKHAHEHILQMLGLSEAAKHAHMYILQMLGLPTCGTGQVLRGR